MFLRCNCYYYTRCSDYTTQTFFKQIRQSWFPEADMDIAKTCLIYLSLDAFAFKPDCLTYSSKRSLLYEPPLFYYAARNWYTHLEKWDDSVSNVALPFLQDDLKTGFVS